MNFGSLFFARSFNPISKIKRSISYLLMKRSPVKIGQAVSDISRNTRIKNWFLGKMIS